MSADLWAEFGKGSEDLSANPWAQRSPVDAQGPLSTFSQTVPQKHEQIDPPLPKYTSTSGATQSNSYEPQTPWGPAESTSHFYKPQAPASINADNAWTDYEESKDDSWSDFASPGEVIDPWSQSKSTFQSIPPWNTSVGGSIAADDFGGFEDPTQEISQDLKLADISSGVTATTESNDRPESSRSKGLSKTSHQRSRSLQQQDQRDPYAGLDSLGKVEKPPATRREVKAVQPPTSQAKPEPILVDENGPSMEDDWDEWSPDPVINAKIAKEQPQKRAPTVKAKAIQHSRSSSEPVENAVPRSQSRSRNKQVEEPSKLPPSNVPPPSILISLVCSLVEKLPTQIEAAMQAFTETDGSNQALEKALRQCLAALRVAARIVAGRKVRWKRDTHLSQSMSIGPAGKSGGMKLSGVDRSEIKREDREVAEFVQVWQKKLGSIRKALAMVNSHIAGKPLSIPDIAQMMLIKTLKQADGGVTAPKSCILCGIKRDERVDKVDLDVFDSFGEWWVDHWGHSECRNFWNEHERYLQQR